MFFVFCICGTNNIWSQNADHQVDRVSALFNAALQLAMSESNEYTRQTSTIVKIGIKYAEINENNYANKMFIEALNLRNDFYNLQDIAKNSSNIEILEQVRNYANRISEIEQKLRVLNEIALKYSSIGKIDEALIMFSESIQLSNKLDRKDYRNRSLERIVIKYAEAGFFDRAIQLASSIEDAFYQGKSLNSIGEFYALAGQNEDALKMFTQAFSIIKYTTNQYGTEQYVMSTICSNLSNINQYDRALELVNSINSKGSKSEALSKIAHNYLRIGKVEEAKRILQVSLNEMLNYEYSTEDLRRQIASIYVELEQFEDAIDIVENFRAENEILTEIASKHYDIGKYDISIQIVNLFNNRVKKAEAFAILSKKYIEDGEYEKAKEVVSFIDIPSINVSVNAEIALHYAENGQKDFAIELLSQILSLAKISSQKSKAESLGIIAVIYAEVGELETAIQIAESIPDIYILNPVFGYIKPVVFADISIAILMAGKK